MKQPGINLFFVFFMLTGFILTTLGQGNVIKLNIFSPIVKTFNIQYEKKLKSDASFQLGLCLLWITLSYIGKRLKSYF